MQEKINDIQDRLLKVLPRVSMWINELHNVSLPAAKPLSSFHFENLPRFFAESVLTAAKVVVSEEMPIPPLTSWGLNELAEFENMQFAGITYKNLYFVKTAHSHEEALHFHELIHVLQ